MGILDRIKLSLGLSYNRHSHKYDTDRLREGEAKMISKDELVKNEKGRITYCKKDKKGSWKCKRTPIKLNNRKWQ